MRVFVSWSGGKDSCLALYRALKAGLKVGCLLNMLNEEGSRSRSHGLPKRILDAQSEALRVPIVYGKASWGNYEEEFKRILASLKSMGIEGGVFGDINLQEHRDWVERVCDEVGIKAFEPLWNEAYEKLIGEFLDSGFQALVVSARADLIGEEWMGKPYDQKFVKYLKERDLDLCGEKGEFHTLVTCGPIFKRRIRILEAGKRVKEGRWFLEILRFSLV